jgi:hypothetical protein
MFIATLHSIDKKPTFTPKQTSKHMYVYFDLNMP